MANIYQLSKELLAIFDELEENGGELTPELEQQLAVTEENFKGKIEDYTKVINHYKDDLNAIKAETDRLKRLKESKERIVERLSKVVIDAIDNFGDENKNGVKYIDYGTGKVSIRRTQAVQLYDDNIEHIIVCLNKIINLENYNNQLDIIDKIEEDGLIDMCARTPYHGADIGITVAPEDLKHIDVELTTVFPLSEILNGGNYDAVKEVVKSQLPYEIKSKVSKSDLKFCLVENGACAPHIGKLVTNKSLTIR